MNLQRIVDRLGGITGVGGGELKPMSSQDIKDLERELGCQFPESYVEFLKTYGASTFRGESPDNPFIVFRSSGPMPPQFEADRGGLDVLYGGENDEHDPYSIRANARSFAGRMPETIIPIGHDGIAGQICLGIKGEQFGKVYYWHQADEPLTEEEYLQDYGEPRPSEEMFRNVYEVADSFGDFLERLEFFREDD